MCQPFQATSLNQMLICCKLSLTKHLCCGVGIVIPGSRIPGLAKPKSGIQDWKNCIFQLKPAYIPRYWYKLEIKLFSHTQTATLLNRLATMLQVVIAFFHSWLTRPIATNERYQSWDDIIWQYWETRLLFGDSVLVYLLTVLQHRWKLKEHFPQREFSQLNCDHDLVIIQSTLLSSS